MSCYTGSTERYLSETWTGWRANPLLAVKALHTHTPKNPTHPTHRHESSVGLHLEYCLPPARFRQSAMMQVLWFHFQCWSNYTLLSIDKIWLVLTAELLRGLTRHPLKFKVSEEPSLQGFNHIHFKVRTPKTRTMTGWDYLCWSGQPQCGHAAHQSDWITVCLPAKCQNQILWKQILVQFHDNPYNSCWDNSDWIKGCAIWPKYSGS